MRDTPLKTDPRSVRSIRLSATLWAALDESALEASAREGRYRSANAILEAMLEAKLHAPPAVSSDDSSIDRMRKARAQKHAQDLERVQRLAEFVLALATATSSRKRRVIDEAKTTVERWRRGGLASPQYIDAWARLLDAEIALIQRALRNGFAELTPQALAANSPFGVEAR